MTVATDLASITAQAATLQSMSATFSSTGDISTATTLSNAAAALTTAVTNLTAETGATPTTNLPALPSGAGLAIIKAPAAAAPASSVTPTEAGGIGAALGLLVGGIA